MDLDTSLLIDYPDLYMRSRLASARTYRFGTGSAMVAMIATMAAGLRRVSTRIETWARGAGQEDLGISYPTVVARLNDVLVTLGFEAGEDPREAERRQRILD